MRRNRHQTSAVDPRLCSLYVGRTPAGLWFAHVCEGSAVVATRRGVVRHRVVTAAQRDATYRYGSPVLVVASQTTRGACLAAPA